MSTIAVTLELDALLRAVITNPDDDTPRLLYADALDELPTARVKCHVCGGTPGPYRYDVRRDKLLPCGVCDGTGEVVDTFPAERAEFVRVQVELGQRGVVGVPPDPYLANLCVIERRLTGCMKERGLLTGSETYRRGFVESWTGTAEEWLKVEDSLFWHPDQVVKTDVRCTQCDGDGYFSFTRSKKSTREKCSYCKGGVAGTVSNRRPCPPSAHPVRKVTLTRLGPDPDGLLIGKDFSVTHTEGHSIWTSSNWPGLPFELVPDATGAASDDTEDWDEVPDEGDGTGSAGEHHSYP